MKCFNYVVDRAKATGLDLLIYRACLHVSYWISLYLLHQLCEHLRYVDRKIKKCDGYTNNFIRFRCYSYSIFLLHGIHTSRDRWYLKRLKLHFFQIFVCKLPFNFYSERGCPLCAREVSVNQVAAFELEIIGIRFLAAQLVLPLSTCPNKFTSLLSFLINGY
jgi:hypothetical protein